MDLQLVANGNAMIIDDYDPKIEAEKACDIEFDKSVVIVENLKQTNHFFRYVIESCEEKIKAPNCTPSDRTFWTQFLLDLYDHVSHLNILERADFNTISYNTFANKFKDTWNEMVTLVLAANPDQKHQFCGFSTLDENMMARVLQRMKEKGKEVRVVKEQ